MKQAISTHWPAFLLTILLSIFALWGTALVPFHPDESTQLFMSGDLETLFNNPISLAWDPAKAEDRKQILHLLDAPLTRYILGFGRRMANLPAPQVDWDWSKSWHENKASGALPSAELLRAGRLSITLLLPLSLLLIYAIGIALGGRSTGLIAMVLLGFNALILLHNRRAMAEGALTFGMLCALWAFIQADRRPWLAGLGMALAFNAKQSTLALLPIGLIAVAWLPYRKNSLNIGNILRSCTVFLAVFGILTFALNPYLWRDPLRATQAAWSARQDLLQRQVADTARLAPSQVLDSAGKRAAVLAANLYITPPSFYEAGNYREQTAASEERYLQVFGHNLMRGTVGGGILLLLSVFGLVIAGIQARSHPPERRRSIVLIFLAMVSQFCFLLFTVPLPWQRYIMPLAPFTCLWSAYALSRPFANR